MANIRVYLKENESNILDFPVTPAEVGCVGASDIQTTKINDLGEISLYGGNRLRTSTLSGFFPNIEYSFCNYPGIKKPYEYVRQIEKWLYNGTKLRLIIGDTHTNMQVILNNFTYKEQPGTRDVYFELSLVEYKEIKLNRTSITEDNNSTRPEEGKPTTPTKTHKVVKGDSLWAIAKKYYGSGSKYPQLKDKNKAKYPSLNKNNIIYVGWVLDI